MDRDRLSERLLATFVGELEDQVQVLNADLIALETSPGDVERVQSVFRVMHTLKGAARAANVPAIEEAAHALEGSLAGARDGRVPPTADQLSLLFAAADAFTAAVASLRSNDPLDPALLRSVAQRAVRAPGTSPGRGKPQGSGRPPGPVAPPPKTVVASPPQAAADAAASEAVPLHATSPAPTEQVRVVAGKLDALLSAAAAALTAADAVADRPMEILAIQDEIFALERDWKGAVTRQRRVLARAGIAESGGTEADGMSGRWHGLMLRIARLARQSSEDSRVLTSATASVTDGVGRLRMRPFGETVESLPRVARDVAVTVGKQVQLELRGQEVEADRAVLDAIREPLVHLVRNAVDHGIESPDERMRKNKAPAGTVTVGAMVEGDRLVVTISDDGNGLDADAVRAGLRRKGRDVGDSDAALAEALLEGGVSTRAEASMVSGRGIGLDVVRSAIAALGGTVTLTWKRGEGTAFVVRVPITLATMRVILVSVTGQLFAIPLVHVEKIVRVKATDIAQVDGRAVIRAASGFVPIVSLAKLLGGALVEKPIEGHADAVIVRAERSGHGAALVVDELIDEREFVARALDRVSGAAARNYTGAVALADERIALIVNVRALVSALAGTRMSGPAMRDSRARKRPRILVVDDSITTRTLEESVLSASGFDVSTAVNGSAAWNKLQAEEFELLLSDVEMPLMDGIALTQAVRASARHKTLPVILVTSLDKPEQRERGLDAGADAYLTKATFDQDVLVATVRRLIGSGR